MKRRAAFPHEITVEHRTPTTTDGRNNAVRTITSTVEGLPAAITYVDDTDNLDDRDRLTRVIQVEALPRWDGADIEIPAQDTVIFDGDRFDLLGSAELRFDHAGRRHHLLFRARRIVG